MGAQGSATTRIRPMRRGGNYDQLNTRQKLFCDEILADPAFSAVTAARKAGYRDPEMAAIRLLRNRVVTSIIGKHVQERLELTHLESDDVIRKIAIILALDPTELFQRVGNHYIVRDFETIPKEIRQCITKIKARTRHLADGTTETSFEVDFMSKDMALSHALKHFGLVGPDNQTTNNVQVGITFQQMLERVENSNGNGHGKVIDGDYIHRLTDDS